MNQSTMAGRVITSRFTAAIDAGGDPRGYLCGRTKVNGMLDASLVGLVGLFDVAVLGGVL